MKQTRFYVVVSMLFFLLMHHAYAQQLGGFTSMLKDQEVNGSKVKAPYPKLSTYLGVANSKNSDCYLYVWIPVPTNEIGIRVVSPVGELSPNVNDVSEKITEENKNTSFDPGVRLEIPATPIYNSREIISEGSSVDWKPTVFNDDSDEIFAQPDGKKSNALIRAALTSPILQGLYRIRISAEKSTKLKGSFCLQAGALENTSGIIIAKDLKSLHKILNP